MRVQERRFPADEMLAGLARRLRILGYDTAGEAGASDVAVVQRSWREGRVLLTRQPQWEGSHVARVRRTLAERVTGASGSE